MSNQIYIIRERISITAFQDSDEGCGESIDRNEAAGYLIARAMAAEVFGNRERRKAFAEAARIIMNMPSKHLDHVPKTDEGKMSGKCLR